MIKIKRKQGGELLSLTCHEHVSPEKDINLGRSNGGGNHQASSEGYCGSAIAFVHA